MLAVALTGCTATRTTQEKTAGWSNNRIYSEARDERSSGGYDRAVELYNVLEGRAAGTTLAQQAQLEKAYTQYQNAEYEEADATLDRFIRLNPPSPGLDYEYYLQGVVNDPTRLRRFVARFLELGWLPPSVEAIVASAALEQTGFPREQSGTVHVPGHGGGEEEAGRGTDEVDAQKLADPH